ncbi:hypothetical protein EJ02DRAFT_457165 [Clathrospora elynae]|uniref:Uncharacterized protein n=1 Tax=Clathrospora elynae TaxID=706981 RepID=A0A6A5SGM3_9PLEO|nr:hypothetical protein EJ02DRAFT_457165 [Clathrospora elynae]
MFLKRNKSGSYGFKNPDFQPLLNSEIRELSTLRKRLTGSSLVALNTGGVTQYFDGRLIANEDFSELGVAVLYPGEGRPDFVPRLLPLYKENHIEYFAIRMRERRHGPAVDTMTDEDKKTAVARVNA